MLLFHSFTSACCHVCTCTWNICLYPLFHVTSNPCGCPMWLSLIVLVHRAWLLSFLLCTYTSSLQLQSSIAPMSFKLARRRAPRDKSSQFPSSASASRTSSPHQSRSSSPSKRSAPLQSAIPKNLRLLHPQQASRAMADVSTVVVSTPAVLSLHGSAASRGRQPGPRSENSFPQSLASHPSPTPINSTPAIPVSDPENPVEVEESFFELYTDNDLDPNFDSATRASKRLKQWQKWANELISSMVKPYLKLLHESKSLCTINCNPITHCTCSHTSRRTVHVTCVFFECWL